MKTFNRELAKVSLVVLATIAFAVLLAILTTQAQVTTGPNRGNTASPTFTGSTTIRTNLNVDSTGSATMDATNILQVVHTNGLRSLVVNRNDGGVYVGSNFITAGNTTLGGLATTIGQTSDNTYIDFLGGSSRHVYGQWAANAWEWYESAGAGISLKHGITAALRVNNDGVISDTTITATNGLAVSTNYVAANMTPQQGLIKLVGSNNVLYAVTTTTTNVVNAYRTNSIGITIDGGGSALTTGVKGFIEVPYNCTILRATMLADQSGSAVVDVWKDTYANYPPTDADSITASAPPTISSATKSQDTTLTGWTTTCTAGDVIGFNVDSATTITRLTLTLVVRQ